MTLALVTSPAMLSIQLNLCLYIGPYNIAKFGEEEGCADKIASSREPYFTTVDGGRVKAQQMGQLNAGYIPESPSLAAKFKLHRHPIA